MNPVDIIMWSFAVLIAASTGVAVIGLVVWLIAEVSTAISNFKDGRK